MRKLTMGRLPFVLVLMIFGVAACIAPFLPTHEDTIVLGTISAAGILYAVICRWRDADMHPLYLLVALIPVIGQLFVLTLLLFTPNSRVLIPASLRSVLENQGAYPEKSGN